MGNGIEIPLFAAQLAQQASTDLPTTFATPGLLPFSSGFNIGVVPDRNTGLMSPSQARSLAREKELEKGQAEVDRIKARADREASYFRIAEGAVKLGTSYLAELQSRDDQLSAMKAYEDYRLKLDTTTEQLSQTQGPDTFLGSVLAARKQLADAALAGVANDNQRFLLDRQITGYNIEHQRAAVLETGRKYQGKELALADEIVDRAMGRASVIPLPREPGAERDAALQRIQSEVAPAFEAAAKLRHMIPDDQLQKYMKLKEKAFYEARAKQDIQRDAEGFAREGYKEFLPGGAFSRAGAEFAADMRVKAFEMYKGQVNFAYEQNQRLKREVEENDKRAAGAQVFDFIARSQAPYMAPGQERPDPRAVTQWAEQRVRTGALSLDAALGLHKAVNEPFLEGGVSNPYRKNELAIELAKPNADTNGLMNQILASRGRGELSDKDTIALLGELRKVSDANDITKTTGYQEGHRIISAAFGFVFDPMGLGKDMGKPDAALEYGHTLSDYYAAARSGRLTADLLPEYANQLIARRVKANADAKAQRKAEREERRPVDEPAGPSLRDRVKGLFGSEPATP